MSEPQCFPSVLFSRVCDGDVGNGSQERGTGYKGEADASAYKLYTWKTELSTEKELIKSVAEDDMLS